MKKVFLSLAVAAALMAGASVANAQEDEAPAPVRRAQVAFVDANGDGICDNIGTRVGTGNGQPQMRQDGNGPHGQGNGPGRGQAQVRKDGNGPHGKGRAQRGNCGR